MLNYGRWDIAKNRAEKEDDIIKVCLLNVSNQDGSRHTIAEKINIDESLFYTDYGDADEMVRIIKDANSNKKITDVTYQYSVDTLIRKATSDYTSVELDIMMEKAHDTFNLMVIYKMKNHRLYPLDVREIYIEDFKRILLQCIINK